jgi:hypothetical protein
MNPMPKWSALRGCATVSGFNRFHAREVGEVRTLSARSGKPKVEFLLLGVGR